MGREEVGEEVSYMQNQAMVPCGDWPNTITNWPSSDNAYPSWSGGYYVPYTQILVTPTDCSGDVHVFPCPHCNKCKCGGATKAKK